MHRPLTIKVPGSEPDDTCPACSRPVESLCRGLAYGCPCGAWLRFHYLLGWGIEGDMLKGTYVGQREELRGKTALVKLGNRGEVEAQFDDVETGLGHEWHKFNVKEFEVV